MFTRRSAALLWALAALIGPAHSTTVTATQRSPSATPTVTLTPIPPSATALPTCGPPSFTPWTAAAPVTTAARLISAASDGTAAYAVGGLAAGGYRSDSHRYDPLANTWTTLPPLPLAVAGASVVYAPNTGKLYVFGGESDGLTISTATQIYDPATQQWTGGTPLPAPRSGMTAGYWNGHIYLAAGADTPRFTPQIQVWAYDPLTDTWDTTLPTLPRDTVGAAGGVINGHLLIAGGANNAAQPLSAVQDYDLATHGRGYLADLPQPVYGAGSAVVNGQLWVFGGGQPFHTTDGTAAHLDRVQPSALTMSAIYEPVGNRWTPGPPLATARVLMGSTAVGNRVIAVAGLSDGGDLNTAERADSVPSTRCPTITPTPSVTGTPPTPTPTPSATPIPCGIWGTIDPWAIRSTLPPPLYGTTLSSDGQYLYEAGGGNSTYPRGTSQVTRYDHMSGTWLARAPLLAASVYSTMTYAPNVGKFYYLGGANETSSAGARLLRGALPGATHAAPSRSYDYNQVYDPTTDHWTSAGNMPDLGRVFFTANYGDGKIYVPGGSLDTGFFPTATLWAYDPLTDSWDINLPPLPIPVLAAASGVINGHLYVAGGSQSSSSVLQTLFDYDIVARTWYTRTPMLQGAAFGESAVLGGRLWVLGGGTPYSGAAGPAVVNTVQIYDPLTDSWSWGPPLTGGRRLGGAAALGDQMFLYGGQDNGYNPIDSLEMTRFHPGLACPSATTTATHPATGTPTATIPATGTPP